jgi:hypothetical protein
VVLRTEDLKRHDDVMRMASMEAAWALQTLPARRAQDSVLRRDLVLIASNFEGSRADRMSVGELQARVARALREERLVALRTSRPVAVESPKQVVFLGPSPVLEEEVERTFIAIELVDQDGQPVANRPFRILLPNNAVQEGRTDREGKAKVKGIEPGTCEIVFPELYDEDFAWKPALPGKRDVVEKGPVLAPFHSAAPDEDEAFEFVDPPIDPDPEPEPLPELDDWISFQLVDGSGAPLRNERYRLVLPDGTSREGVVNPQGFARLEGIDPPGACELFLPDRGDGEWHVA